MARIKIQMPETIIDTIDIAVRITDINYGNHVGNDAMVSIIHEARVQWLKKLHYEELDIEGATLIMSDLAVEYINESFYGDYLNIDIAIAEISRVSFELYYSIATNRAGKTILIARAKTGMVFYDYSAKKPTPVPEKFKLLF